MPLYDSARTGRTRHPAWLVLIFSLWIATVCNIPLWREWARMPELQNLRGLAVGAGFAVTIAAAMALLFSLLNWRWTLKPFITLSLFAAAFGAHFMLSYGVVIDTTMLVNALETDVRETRDLVNLRMLATVLVMAVLPSIWLWRQRTPRRSALRQIGGNLLGAALALGVLVGSLLLIFQDFSSLMRNHTEQRYLINPLNAFYALGDIAAKPFKRDERTILPIGQDAQLRPAPGKPPLLLLVVGETGRAGQFTLNGYARPTTPELAKEHLASYRNAWSCGTNTAASVPCMFSHLGKQGFEGRKANYEGLLDVLQRSGLGVVWLDNQAGCKGVCDRVPHTSTAQVKDKDLCIDGECFDEIMLRLLDARIAELPAERRAKGVVVLMHQMGSHGPAYYKRTPAAFKRFLPECTSNNLQDCSQTLLVNAYDNTIAYTDHVLASAIQWLKSKEAGNATAMVYVADHGESLGENNIYLHGLPYDIAPDVQKHVPWITWLSPAYEQRSHVATACLQKQQDVRISHDNYFHSVLGLLGVATSVYQPALDIFQPCIGAK
ncbi:phosphoethanolamine transferase [Rhodoferax sp. WC2427]|uniref:phosphoethanolamine transferase n=1 Tax=Rhodoferax sp. WC2427 TaxID=3234144 RepID=UPI003467D04A